jgi:Acetyltransferase (GNAT) domain
MKLERLNDIAALRALQPQWTQLYQSLPGASVFTSPSWVLNWLDNFAPQTPLRCLTLWDDASSTQPPALRALLPQPPTLRAVLPLLPVRTQWRRVPVTALTACTNAHSVRSAILFDQADRSAVFNALAQDLRSAPDWDMLLLDGCDLPMDPSGASALPRELAPERWQHCTLTVQGAWDAYLASLSRDLRRNLRRVQADLSAMGAVQFEVIEDDAEKLFAHWVTVDRASWKADHGETVDSNAQTQSYYRRMLTDAAALNQLLGVVLMLNNQAVGTLIALRDKGVLYTLKTATRADLSTARLSVGALLMAHLLQTVWQRGDVHQIDFVNKAPYTTRWTTQTREFERRVAFAPSWRGQAAGWLERICQRMNERTGAQMNERTTEAASDAKSVAA